MRTARLFSMLCLASLLLAGAGTALTSASEHEASADVTLRGEILDMACYVAHEAKGSDHAGCAKRCAKGGQPMGLLSEDGTVYLLYASHEDGSAFEKAKEFAGQKVEITGVTASKANINGLEVHGVKQI